MVTNLYVKGAHTFEYTRGNETGNYYMGSTCTWFRKCNISGIIFLKLFECEFFQVTNQKSEMPYALKIQNYSRILLHTKKPSVDESIAKLRLLKTSVCHKLR